jgi:hypothetical protein
MFTRPLFTLLTFSAFTVFVFLRFVVTGFALFLALKFFWLAMWNTFWTSALLVVLGHCLSPDLQPHVPQLFLSRRKGRAIVYVHRTCLPEHSRKVLWKRFEKAIIWHNFKVTIVMNVYDTQTSRENA